jgi:gamma-glutamyltranspeptidase / glutathione hydrolase
MTRRILAIALTFCATISATPSIPLATPVFAPHAIVVTEQRSASQAGLDVLRRGGNAVDAAVAVGYALAVVDPCCGNIGGGGFMLIRMHGGQEHFIDFREKAPLRATRDMFLDARGDVDPRKARKGWLSIGVPGTVMGLDRALDEYGTMHRNDVMSYAIALAKDGYTFSSGDEIPFVAAADGYNPASGFAHHPKPGDLVKQPQLAQTLEEIARDGDAAFYRGPIARAIVAASDANGGILSMRDFADYTVDERQPVQCAYHGYDLISAPPPSSGGVTLCEILNVIAPFPLARWGWHSVRETHDVIEAERRAYADRNQYLGDPAFVKNPVAQLLDPSYAARLRASIDPTKATPSSDVKPGLRIATHENDDTTHFSIVDRWGNAVAVTYTINDWFGAGVIAGDTGFFLNDEMDDFTSKPGVANMYGLVQGSANEIAPGKRPLSSMAPTIVTRNGQLVMVTGSPGGSRIITIVLETLLNVLDFGMNVQQAVDAPRIHMQWLPDRVQYEPNAFATGTMEQLQSDGYTFEEVQSWGSAQAIVRDPATGMLAGGTDRRRPSGAALGY